MADDKTFTQADLDAAIAKATAKIEESVSRLEAKNEEVIGENRKLKQQVRAAGEITPETLQAAEDRADKAEAKIAELDKSVKTLTGERDKAVKALEAETGFTSKLLVQDGLKSALIANGVKDEDFIDTLSAKFALGAQVVTEGDARVAKIGDKSISDHIKEWAASDAGKKFVEAPNNSGGGAGGGKGGQGDAVNPFAKESFNMTEQGRLYKEDPAKAAALAKEAGASIAA